MAELKNQIRVAPNSKESEMMVLGCMLTSINSLNAAADGLDDTDFYYTEHQGIFDVLKTLYKMDKPADVHLVCEELKRRDKLQAVGGAAYITTLAQYAGTSAYIEEYIEIVKGKAILRRMINASQVIERNALSDPPDVYDSLDEAQKFFFEISQSVNSNEGTLLRDLFSGVKSESQVSYLKELQERQERFLEHGGDAPLITGIQTHYTDLDKMLNGFNNSNLIILAARPAMGKTALAMNVAENVCFKSGLPVGIFSCEMSADQLVHRIVCSQAEVESDKIKTGALSGVEYQRIVEAVNMMQGQLMVIDDQPGLKITDLRARARRMKERFGIRLLIIDYLQLLSGGGRSQENRQNEISEISRNLKNLARELNIPVLCLSQLSRKVEERHGHRPMISDLRESGCLAGDTLIKDAETGELHTIKDLAEREEQTPLLVFGVDENLKMGKHVMSRVFYSGKKVVYELRTRSGRSIKASANHPFLKLEGWTRLDQLRVGDCIALPRHLTQNNKSKRSASEWALLAHLLGDGCILPKQPYHYTSMDDENIRIVQEASQELFGISGRLVKQKNWHHFYLKSPVQLTHGKKHPITTWYEDLGIGRVRSYEKVLPKEIFTCSKEEVAHFLRHLWATDGNISEKKMEGRKNSAAIYYASSSQTLCQQVQHLLLYLDIQANVRKVPSAKGYRDMFHVLISGAENQSHFLSKVGCAGSRGEIIPKLEEQLKKIVSNLNQDIIPKEAWDLFVGKAKEEKNLSWRDVCEKLGMSYCGSTLFKSGLSRARMQKLADILESKKLESLAQSDVYWDEITEITELEEVDVYDATVEGVHNFVANDIYVHNSIEQDADIVLLLFRRDYYDPMEKPGMVEVIVAKNRHGAVGNVNLTYRKEIAQFANYTSIQSYDPLPGGY